LGVSHVFGQPFVKRFALCYQTIVYPVCLSVTLVYCGQTVGWTRMSLGMEVGLNPGDIVLYRDPALPHGKGHSSPLPLFGPLCSDMVAHLSWALVLLPSSELKQLKMS